MNFIRRLNKEKNYFSKYIRWLITCSGIDVTKKYKISAQQQTWVVNTTIVYLENNMY